MINKCVQILLAVILIHSFNIKIANAGLSDFCPFDANTCQVIEETVQNIVDNSSYTSGLGFNINKRIQCCIKTYGKASDGTLVEKNAFGVDETVYFHIDDEKVGVWGFAGSPLYPGLSYSDYDYIVGFSLEGTYLDESCHSKLRFINHPTISGYVRFSWEQTDLPECYTLSHYVDGTWTLGGYYAYSTPGVKVITGIPLPYAFFNHGFNIPMPFKVIVVGDEYVDDDNDGLFNDKENELGTDPNNSDTDGDGVNDYEELASGRSPLFNEAVLTVLINSILLD